MTSETKNCQNCKNQFTIESADFDFYKKMEVPPPTFCSECRLIRRFIERNERTLYRRTCDLCKKDILAMYGTGTTFPVYCHECWWGDGWDPMSYGQKYDFSKPFFLQYQELFNKVPRINFWQRNATNCSYSNMAYESKNTYLSQSVVKSEEVYYSRAVDDSYHVYDCLNVNKLNSCYGGVYNEESNNTHFSFRIRNCIDSYFLFDCIDCQNCILSSNLRHKKYVIRNIQYSKEEYFEKLKEFDFGSYEKLEQYKKEFRELLHQAVHRYADLFACSNSTGDALANSKNAENCYEGWELENVKNLVRGYYLKDSQDISFILNSQKIYEYITGGTNSADLFFCLNSLSNLQNAYYSDLCGVSSNLFGCIGLRNKKHCILNVEYSKEEYEELLPKIIDHARTMSYRDERGVVYGYGEFFPFDFSPFAYNETLTQQYFPLKKEEALARGYQWKDPEVKAPIPTKNPHDLSDHIEDTDETVLQEIIGCSHEGRCNEQCTFAFKVIPQELGFYKKINLPLPRLCPNCRHYERLAHRNPFKLWERQCMCDYKIHENSVSHEHHASGKCQNIFQTSYAPERPEIVYCESCYNAEVV